MRCLCLFLLLSLAAVAQVDAHQTFLDELLAAPKIQWAGIILAQQDLLDPELFRLLEIRLGQARQAGRSEQVAKLEQLEQTIWDWQDGLPGQHGDVGTSDPRWAPVRTVVQPLRPRLPVVLLDQSNPVDQALWCYRQGQLYQAIVRFRVLLARGPDADILRYLANCYERRYDRDGSPLDLEEAWTAYQQAFQLEDSPLLRWEIERVRLKREKQKSPG